MNTLLSLAIFGSFMWLAIIVSLVLVFLFVAEGKENGYVATFVVCVFLVVNYFWGNVPVFDFLTFRNVGIYLFVGFLYSVVRTFFFGREFFKEQIYTNDEVLRKAYLNDIKRKLKNNVFRWWFLFPISMIYWAVSDLVIQVWDWVYDQVHNFYEYIFNLSKPNTK